jgi:hypothetical protein
MTVRIYQIYFLPEQRAGLDPAFEPFDWTANPDPRLKEIAIFRDLHARGLHQSAEVVGAMSPKFGIKTRMSGRAFVDFIAANPGHDVYFVNPFPQIAYYTYNLWEQGETSHPGLTERAQRLLDHCGVDIRIDGFPRTANDRLLFCNYWAGTPAFWDRYMAFINRLHDAIMLEMTDGDRARYFEFTRHDQPTEFYPFIFERMFTTYLVLHPEIRALAYRHSPEEVTRCCIQKYEDVVYQAMREEVDRWDREGVFTEERRQILRDLRDLIVLNSKVYAEPGVTPPDLTVLRDLAPQP